MTHGDSSPFAWVVADARPGLVKAIIVVEPSTAPFAGGGRGGPFGNAGAVWGLTASRITFDPPASTPGELRNMPRRLPNHADIPMAVVTGDASPNKAAASALLAFLRQAGCTADALDIGQAGVRGNGPYLMIEKNSREALQPVLDWLDQRAPASGTPQRSAASRPVNPQPGDSTGMKLADTGHFWVGIGRKQMPYGTVASGQTFVQYFVPSQVRHRYPIVLVHGGGGQSTHMMGIGRRPGWLHFFVQEGYRVYAVDRPGFGRAPYHPDSLGPSQLGLFPAYDGFAASPAVIDTVRWAGTRVIGEDPLIDQFMANEVGNATDEAYHSELCAAGGVELLDRIGPSLVLGHAFGGFLGWILADRRPNLVKGIMCVEINGNPFAGQLRWGRTAIPLAYDPPRLRPGRVQAGRRAGAAQFAADAAYDVQASGRAGPQTEESGEHPHWLVDGRIRWGRAGLCQRRLSQAGRLPCRTLAPEGPRHRWERQSDAVGDERHRQVFDIITGWFDRNVDGNRVWEPNVTPVSPAVVRYSCAKLSVWVAAIRRLT